MVQVESLNMSRDVFLTLRDLSADRAVPVLVLVLPHHAADASLKCSHQIFVSLSPSRGHHGVALLVLAIVLLVTLLPSVLLHLCETLVVVNVLLLLGLVLPLLPRL